MTQQLFKSITADCKPGTEIILVLDALENDDGVSVQKQLQVQLKNISPYVEYLQIAVNPKFIIPYKTIKYIMIEQD